jgi:hypothetical protein
MVRGRSVTDLQQAAMDGEWQRPSRLAGESRSSFSQTLGNSGSEDMLTPSVSPDGKFLSALHTAAAQQLSIYDFGSAKWSNLRSTTTGYRPAWTRDSSALYLITREGELQRYRSATGKLESVVKMPGSLPPFGLLSLQGLAVLSVGLDGAPLVARDQGSSQIYAIKWQN